jgi:hypothetical protein
MQRLRPNEKDELLTLPGIKTLLYSLKLFYLGQA